MVVAQLAERSLPIPDIRGWNPVMSNILYWIYLLLTVQKTKIKKKRPGLSHLKKTVLEGFEPTTFHLWVEYVPSYYTWTVVVRISIRSFHFLKVWQGFEPATFQLGAHGTFVAVNFTSFDFLIACDGFEPTTLQLRGEYLAIIQLQQLVLVNFLPMWPFQASFVDYQLSSGSVDANCRPLWPLWRAFAQTKTYGRYSSVVLSEGAILSPRVRISNLHFFQLILLKLYLCCWNDTRTKINKKRPGLVLFSKKPYVYIVAIDKTYLHWTNRFKMPNMDYVNCTT